MNSTSALQIFSKSTINLCRRSCLLSSSYPLRRFVAAYKPPSTWAQARTSIVNHPFAHYGTTANQMNLAGSIVPSRCFHLSTATFDRGSQRKESGSQSENKTKHRSFSDVDPTFWRFGMIGILGVTVLLGFINHLRRKESESQSENKTELGSFTLTGKDSSGKGITCNIYPGCIGEDIVIIFGGEEYRFTVTSGELQLFKKTPSSWNPSNLEPNFVLKGKDSSGKAITCNIYPGCIGEDIIIILGRDEYRFTVEGVSVSNFDLTLSFSEKLLMIGISVVLLGFIGTILCFIGISIGFIGIGIGILCLPFIVLLLLSKIGDLF